MGVKKTYFFMRSSPAYNLMSRHSRVALQKIIEMGHEIGLHYDAGHPCVNEVNMIIRLRLKLYGDRSNCVLLDRSVLK